MTGQRTLCIALLALLPAGCASEVPLPERSQPGPWEQRALAEPEGPNPVPLRLVVPAEGSIVPWTFPSLVFRWEDDFQADAFLVRIRAGDARQVLLEAFTAERRLPLSPVEWQRIRSQAGEGGEFEVELTGASLMPSGRVFRGPTTVRARSRFSGPEEHPTGYVHYAQQFRPIGAPPGPSDRSHRLLSPVRVSMDGKVEVQLEGIFDKWILPDGHVWKQNKAIHYSDLGVPEWAARPAEPVATRSLDFSAIPNKLLHSLREGLYQEPQGPCMGCHMTRSGDGTYLAFNAALDDRRPGLEKDTFNTLFVVRSDDRTVLVERLYGFFPRFHPRMHDILAYSQWANELKDGFMASVFHADVRVLDIASGREFPLPGASEPDRCEIVPEWSPDGEWVVFARSLAGEPCDGQRGRLEIAKVPWNEGRGGPATVLVEGNEGARMQPRFSPDGRWIVFYRTDHGYFSKGSADLWAVPAQGGAAFRLDVSTDAMESWHAFSPDGKWLAFQSNRESVDKVKGYVVRFFEDGRVSPALPLPGAGDTEAMIISIDWTR